jgi:predicted nucleotidyltransferase
MGLSHLSPQHLLPVGTQVVLKREIGVVGGGRFKKPGAVGEVLEAPLTNDYSYLIGFTDGSTVRAKKSDLTVRRCDHPEANLPPREITAYSEHVFYRVLVGSHAYGLADEQSDRDERGVFLPPAEWHWSLQPLPEQIEFKRLGDGTIVNHHQPGGDEDVCWWELAKLLRLALKANPNILEILYLPEQLVLHCDELGHRLRELRDCFLSTYLYQSYSGYVLSQFKRMQRSLAQGKSFRRKHAMHLIRLLYSGIAALEGRGILVDVGEVRDELLAIKKGDTGFDEIYRRALELDRRFQQARADCKLPAQPDVERVDRFLIEARRSKVS